MAGGMLTTFNMHQMQQCSMHGVAVILLSAKHPAACSFLLITSHCCLFVGRSGLLSGVQKRYSICGAECHSSWCSSLLLSTVQQQLPSCRPHHAAISVINRAAGDKESAALQDMQLYSIGQRGTAALPQATAVLPLAAAGDTAARPATYLWLHINGSV